MAIEAATLHRTQISVSTTRPSTPIHSEVSEQLVLMEVKLNFNVAQLCLKFYSINHFQVLMEDSTIDWALVAVAWMAYINLVSINHSTYSLFQYYKLFISFS
jgi:hypothetical protein